MPVFPVRRQLPREPGRWALPVGSDGGVSSLRLLEEVCWCGSAAKNDIMNLVLYGFSEAQVARLVARYGFAVCRSFEEFGAERCLLASPRLGSERLRCDFFERMIDNDARIDAVVVLQDDSFGVLRYGSQPGKFFSVGCDAEEEQLEWELDRIVCSRLGLLCAHEGV